MIWIASAFRILNKEYKSWRRLLIENLEFTRSRSRSPFGLLSFHSTSAPFTLRFHSHSSLHTSILPQLNPASKGVLTSFPLFPSNHIFLSLPQPSFYSPKPHLNTPKVSNLALSDFVSLSLPLIPLVLLSSVDMSTFTSFVNNLVAADLPPLPQDIDAALLRISRTHSSLIGSTIRSFETDELAQDYQRLEVSRPDFIDASLSSQLTSLTFDSQIPSSISATRSLEWLLPISSSRTILFSPVRR